MALVLRAVEVAIDVLHPAQISLRRQKLHLADQQRWPIAGLRRLLALQDVPAPIQSAAQSAACP